jgi:ribosomal protein S16
MRFKPFKIKLKQVLIKNYVVFKIELHKIRSKGNSFFLEKLGYYNTDPFRKIISINTYRLGF